MFPIPARAVSRTQAASAVALLMLAALLPAPKFGEAGIVSVTDVNRNVQIDTGIPAIVAKDHSDAIFTLWTEQQDVVLAKDIKVNWLAETGKKGKLAGGGVVASHYLQWDGVASTGETGLTATVNFASEILAIITKTKTLKKSDFLGLDGVEYNSFKNRGLERRDQFFVSEDGKSLTIDWNAPDPGDWIRVITAANPIIVTDDPPYEDPPFDPEPEWEPNPNPQVQVVTSVPTPAALPAGLALMAWWTTGRRRRKQTQR